MTQVKTKTKTETATAFDSGMRVPIDEAQEFRVQFLQLADRFEGNLRVNSLSVAGFLRDGSKNVLYKGDNAGKNIYRLQCVPKAKDQKPTSFQIFSGQLSVDYNKSQCKAPLFVEVDDKMKTGRVNPSIYVKKEEGTFTLKFS